MAQEGHRAIVHRRLDFDRPRSHGAREAAHAPHGRRVAGGGDHPGPAEEEVGGGGEKARALRPRHGMAAHEPAEAEARGLPDDRSLHAPHVGDHEPGAGHPRESPQQAQVGPGGRGQHQDVHPRGRFHRARGPRHRSRPHRPPPHAVAVHADHPVSGPGQRAGEGTADEPEPHDRDRRLIHSSTPPPNLPHGGGRECCTNYGSVIHSSPRTRARISGSRREKRRAAPATIIA